MTYQVLARKWRPKNFAEMVGQAAVVRTLENAFSQDRLHHAYLFTGTRGVGKTTIARIIAKCLNCETGITATPCGKCPTCLAIDAGQFVDLIEVDAASRTKVEDTRELLDNVQYAPTQGRYKIYLIDEVHMLSGHSFNALLKTLEEPPEHVKFLLATTDPQKLPITILSRCLQFHLKGIAPDIIAEHLAYILEQENLQFEKPALELIATAAHGSMRDALSILDQAIAFGGQQVDTDSTRTMLGSTAIADLTPLLDALAKRDGEALMQHVQQLAEQGVDFNQVLNDLLQFIHKLSYSQLLPTALPTQEAEQYTAYLDVFSAEDLQLFYQIGVVANRDMAFAPSPRTGFEMALLRMLYFQRANSDNKQPVTHTKPAPEAKSSPTAAKAKPSKAVSDDWATTVAALNLKGMTKVLAQNCSLAEQTEQAITLTIAPQHQSLAHAKMVAQLEDALQQHYQDSAKLTINVAETVDDTPANAHAAQQAAELDAATQSIVNDPHVQAILNEFGGSLDTASIKPVKN